MAENRRKLEKLMSALLFKQADLAELLGVSRTAVSQEMQKSDVSDSFYSRVVSAINARLGSLQNTGVLQDYFDTKKKLDDAEKRMREMQDQIKVLVKSALKE